MRFLSPLVALTLLASVPAHANELARVYGLAQTNDAQLQAAVGARDAQLQNTPATRGALLPQIGASGQIAHENDRLTHGVFPNDTGTGFVTSKDATGSPHSLSLSLRQTIFDAAAWSRWQQSDATDAAAEASYRSVEQNLVLRTTQAYFDLLYAADNVRFVDAEKKAFERQLDLAKKRFEVGISAVTDVQEAQARYDLSVSQMILAESGLTTARLALTNITGSNDARIVALKDEIPLIGPNPDNVNDWLKRADDANTDILLAQANVEIAKQDIDIKRAGHYPTVTVAGSKSKGKQSGFQTYDYDTDRVELDVNVPIFAGASVQAGVNAANAIYQQRLAQLDGTKRGVELTVRNAYMNVLTGVAQVKALKQAVVSNTTALEASQVGLEVGSRTQVDVLGAQQQLYGAQANYSKSRYDYLLSILKLKIAAGVLTQKDLNEIDELLGTEVTPQVAG